MTIQKSNLYPQGTSMTTVIEEERKLREEAEAILDRRIHALEERFFIAQMNPEWDTVSYPQVMEAFHKFKEEELKMMTFEAIKHGKTE
jgi:hypothetical protein